MTPEVIQKLIEMLENSGDPEAAKIIEALKNFDQNQKTTIREAHSALKDYQDSLKQTQLQIKANMEAEIAQAEQRRDLLIRVAEAQGASEEQIRAITEAEDARVKKLRVQAEATEEVREATNRFLGKAGLGKDLTKSFMGKMLLSGGKGFNQIAAAIGDALTPQALFASGLAQMEKATMELFTSFDRAASGLNKTTGATGEFNDMLYDAQESSKLYNVDVGKAAEAIGQLHDQLSSFTSMNKETQAELTEATARMTAFGVETSITAANFDIMIQGMGMTADSAVGAQTELLALSDTIGVGMGKIANDFKSASAELAKYGPDAVDVFKGVAAAAKATGIEVSALMGLAKQFDTFEGAASSAGKLNAILGGGVINSMDLLNANEEERIRLLIQSMHLSGKSWEHLNRFEKQAIASAAGISDMTEANKMFSMSLTAYDEMQSKADAASISQQKLEERAAAGVEFGDKMKMIGQAFAVAFMPLLDAFRWFLDLILQLNDMTSGLFLPTMVALIGVVAMLTQVQSFAALATSIATGFEFARTAVTVGLSAAMAGLTTTQTTTTTTTVGFTAASAAMITTLAPAIPMIIAVSLAIAGLGFAVAGVGLAIAAPFLAIAAIVTALKEVFIAILQMPKALANAVIGLVAFAAAGATAMVILAAGMAAAVTILIPFTLQMAVVAPALAYFGAAMAVAVLPMYLFAQALGELGEALAKWAGIGFGQIFMAATALATFALLLIPIALPLFVGGALAGIGLVLLGAGLEQFAKGLKAFQEVTGGDILMAGLALYGFAMLLTQLSLQMFVAGALTGIGLILLGTGLQKFAEGLMAFGDFQAIVMGAVAAVLALGIMMALLIPLAKPIAITSLIVGLPLMFLAMGLTKFAKAISEFADFEEIMTAAVAAVGSIGLMMLMFIPLTKQILVVGILVGLPLMLIGLGLNSFGQGMQQFIKIKWDTILKAMGSLVGIIMLLGNPVFGVLVWIAAALTGIPLMLIGLGLQRFAEGLQEFNWVAGSSIDKAITSLVYFMEALGGLKSLIGYAFLIVSIPLMALGLGLQWFADALWEYNFISKDAIDLAVKSLKYFMTSMVANASVVSMIGLFVGGPLLVFAVGLYTFGKALQKFNRVGPEEINAAVTSLNLFLVSAARWALYAPLMLALGPAFWLLGWGLEALAEGFDALFGMDTIITGLGVFFTALTQFSLESIVALSAVASAVENIAEAITMVPEGKMLEFGVAMLGLSGVAAASDAAARVGDAAKAAAAGRTAPGAAPGAAATGGTERPIEVTLEIDGEKFAKAVVRAIDKSRYGLN